MYKRALILSLNLLFVSPAWSATAKADKWLVTQLSGDARVVHPGFHAASLKVNEELAPGDTLLTGPTGRATLVHGGDYILIAPRSEMRLPSAVPQNGFTRVIENLGTMLFKVQHTGIPHFVVDTPMLAAVVKGTTFTVVVDQNRSAVQVTQGVVQVSAVQGGMSQLVEGGRTVFVDHDTPTILRDADRPAAAVPSASSVQVRGASTESPLASIAQLTGGLVHADAIPENTNAAPPIAILATTETATHGNGEEGNSPSSDTNASSGTGSTTTTGTSGSGSTPGGSGSTSGGGSLLGVGVTVGGSGTGTSGGTTTTGTSGSGSTPGGSGSTSGGGSLLGVGVTVGSSGTGTSGGTTTTTGTSGSGSTSGGGSLLGLGVTVGSSGTGTSGGTTTTGTSGSGSTSGGGSLLGLGVTVGSSGTGTSGGTTTTTGTSGSTSGGGSLLGLGLSGGNGSGPRKP
jgi:uncharacterized membrane protein YgcG